MFTDSFKLLSDDITDDGLKYFRKGMNIFSAHCGSIYGSQPLYMQLTIQTDKT